MVTRWRKHDNVLFGESPQTEHLEVHSNRQRDTLPRTTTEMIKTQPDGEDYRESEPTSVSQPFSEANPDYFAAQE